MVSINNFLNLPTQLVKPKYSDSFKYKISIIVFSFIYALLLISIIYEGIPDRHNYLSYASNSLLIFAIYFDKGYTSLLLNEPLWLLSNIILKTYFEPEVIVKILIFIPAFTVSYVTLRENKENFFLLVLLLLLPQLVKNHFVQIRQGLAISVFIIGYFSRLKRNKWILIISTPLFHSSFFFVTLIYIITDWMKRYNFSSNLRIIVYIIVGLALSILTILIGVFLPIRQLHDVDTNILRSFGFGFIFWVSVAIFMLLNSTKYVKTYSFEIGAVLFYVASYVFFPWSGRIFESMLIFVIIACLKTSYIYRIIIAILLLTYGLLNWILVIMFGSTMFGL